MRDLKVQSKMLIAWADALRRAEEHDARGRFDYAKGIRNAVRQSMVDMAGVLSGGKDGDGGVELRPVHVR